MTDIDKVKNGEMSHLEYLNSSKHCKNYQDWCNSHGVEQDEESAEFYFDQCIDIDYDENKVAVEVYP